MINKPKIFWTFAFVGFVISFLISEYIAYKQGYSIRIMEYLLFANTIIAFLFAFVADFALIGTAVSNQQLKAYLACYAIALALIYFLVMAGLHEDLIGPH